MTKAELLEAIAHLPDEAPINIVVIINTTWNYCAELTEVSTNNDGEIFLEGTEE